jgi:hypothetical protein
MPFIGSDKINGRNSDLFGKNTELVERKTAVTPAAYGVPDIALPGQPVRVFQSWQVRFPDSEATAAAPARIVLMARRRVVIKRKVRSEIQRQSIWPGLAFAVMRTLAQQMNEFFLN